MIAGKDVKIKFGVDAIATIRREAKTITRIEFTDGSDVGIYDWDKSLWNAILDEGKNDS